MAKNVKSKAVGVPMSNREHTSVSVEKISNGYLVRTSTSNGEKYTEKTEYCAQKPKVTVPVITKKK